MKGRNRKKIRVRNKPARDAHWRRITRDPQLKNDMVPKPVPDEAAAKFYATEAAAPVEDK